MLLPWISMLLPWISMHHTSSLAAAAVLTQLIYSVATVGSMHGSQHAPYMQLTSKGKLDT